MQGRAGSVWLLSEQGSAALVTIGALTAAKRSQGTSTPRAAWHFCRRARRRNNFTIASLQHALGALAGRRYSTPRILISSFFASPPTLLDVPPLPIDPGGGEIGQRDWIEESGMQLEKWERRTTHLPHPHDGLIPCSPQDTWKLFVDLCSPVQILQL